MKNIYIKLLFSYIFVLIFALSITYISFFIIIKKEINNEISNNLIKITDSIKISIINILDKPEDELQNEIKKYGQGLNLRITLIDKKGVVLADSNYNPEEMENHLLREEVQAALMGNPEVFKRYSKTLKEDMYYYAILLNYNEQSKIILRVSFFTKVFSKIYKKIFEYLIIIFVSVLLTGIIISYIFSSNISRNFQSIYNFLKNLSFGEFKERIFLKKPEEFKELSVFLNKTAEKLEELFLRAENEKEELTSILENIEEPMAVIKNDGKVSYANNSFLKIFLKDSFSDLYYFQILNNLKVLELLEKHLKEKKDFVEEIKIGNRFFLIKIKYLPHLFESLLILYDITSFKEIIRIKKELVSNISHEIKTPLTVIYGYIEFLEESLKDNELNMVIKIKEQVEKLKILTEEMLNLSAIEEGRIDEKFEKINILNPIKAAIDSYKTQYEKKGLFIKLQVQKNLYEIKGSQKLLERLFLNLLDNSLKFTENGGVNIKLKEEEKNLLVEFEDTGIGIKEEDLPLIFERFYVSEKGRQKEKSGFGLGLSIVKHIADLHKGKIEVKSQRGKGTYFILYFPF